MNKRVTREEAIRILRDSKPSTSMKEGEVFDRVVNVNIAIDMAIEALKEQKVGRWKAKDFHTCYCTNCNFTFDIMKCDFMDKMMFCPNCGAIMGADEREEK